MTERLVTRSERAPKDFTPRYIKRMDELREVGHIDQLAQFKTAGGQYEWQMVVFGERILLGDENLYRGYLMIEPEDFPTALDILIEIGEKRKSFGKTTEFKWLTGKAPNENERYHYLKSTDPRIVLYSDSLDNLLDTLQDVAVDPRWTGLEENRNKKHSGLFRKAPRRPGTNVLIFEGQQLRSINYNDRPGFSEREAADPNWRDSKIGDRTIYIPVNTGKSNTPEKGVKNMREREPKAETERTKFPKRGSMALAGLGLIVSFVGGMAVEKRSTPIKGDVSITSPTPTPDITDQEAPKAASIMEIESRVSQLTTLRVGRVEEVFRAEHALAYPTLISPDPSRAPKFPDVPQNGHRALVAYEAPFEDGDYFQHKIGDIDLPQYYYRVMTAGEIVIPELGVNCKATKEKGCATILINHFGDTAMFRETIVDNGFTVAGRVFDMGKPRKVTESGQALLDHYMGRMTNSVDGANCGTIDACQEVEWHVVVVGGGKAQAHWAGLYQAK